MLKWNLLKVKFHSFKFWISTDDGVHVEVKVGIGDYVNKNGDMIFSNLKIHGGRTTGGVGYLDVNDKRLISVFHEKEV